MVNNNFKEHTADSITFQTTQFHNLEDHNTSFEWERSKYVGKYLSCVDGI
jgi:hypothetical protein